MIRQTRTSRAAASAWGGSSDDDYQEPSYSERKRRESGEVVGKKSEKRYMPPWLIDPAHGGEVTPTYGEEEIQVLPINLGYSIMETSD